MLHTTALNNNSNKFLDVVKDYCKTSTIQAFRNIVAPERHFLERVFWVIVISSSAVLASVLIFSSYKRYETDPTVITLDKNYRDWDTPLPGTTLCFSNRLNETKANLIIQKKWNTTKRDRYEYYKSFLSCVANANYNNLEPCLPFANDSTLNNLDAADLALQVNYDLVQYSGATFHSSDVDFHQTLSEMGLCYSYNSLITRYFYPGLKKSNVSREINPPLCNIFQLFCYGKIVNLDRAIQFYTHSSYDSPLSTTGVDSLLRMETDAGYEVLRTVAAGNVRKLRPSQRKCIFFDERRTGEAPFYTYNLCVMNCRRVLAIKVCGCVPFFNVKREKELHCKIKDIECLYKYSNYLETLFNRNTRERYKCDCPPQCTSMVYYRTYNRTLEMAGGAYQNKNSTIYQWVLERLPRTQLKREVLYDVEDLLVSWGGIAGFFLGCSLISGIELAYFFTVKLVRYLCCTKTGKKHYDSRRIQSRLNLKHIEKRNLNLKRTDLYQYL